MHGTGNLRHGAQESVTSFIDTKLAIAAPGLDNLLLLGLLLAASVLTLKRREPTAPLAPAQTN